MSGQEENASEDGLSAPRRASEGRVKKPTPLPIFPLLSVFLIQLGEPIAATVIYPFIAQFVRETDITGGDEKKTGYYAGIIVRLIFSISVTSRHSNLLCRNPHSFSHKASA